LIDGAFDAKDISLVSTPSDSVDGAESELEKQEVELGKDKKLKKEVNVEDGKEKLLEFSTETER
jgi:hypothetical protein